MNLSVKVEHYRKCLIAVQKALPYNDTMRFVVIVSKYRMHWSGPVPYEIFRLQSNHIDAGIEAAKESIDWMIDPIAEPSR